MEPPPTAPPARLALHRNDVARIVRRLVAQRIGADEPVRQMQVDMGAGLEGRQFPTVGIGEREQLYACARRRYAGNDRLGRRDRTHLHAAFRTVSPTLTMPPCRILQLRPE